MTTALIESPSAALGLFFMLTSLDIIYREVFSYLLSEVGSKGIDFIMLKLKQSNNNFITEEKEVHTNTYWWEKDLIVKETLDLNTIIS